MYLAIIVICGLADHPTGCLAIINRTPHLSQAACEADLRQGVYGATAALPEGAFISDGRCVAMSVAG